MAGERSSGRGDPNVSVLLTWFLPGAGHLYLGKLAPAMLAFLVVEGLYAAGWALSRGRVFEFLDPELRGPFATLLTPEFANLGAMIAQHRVVGFGSGEPHPFPPHVALGGILMGLSGLANVLAMVHVHLQARADAVPRRATHPAILVGLGWLLPGLGHFAQGRRLRGAIVCALLLGLFAAGTWLAAGSNLSRERHFYYWSGQFLLGLPAIVTEILSGRPPVTGPIRFVDVGLLYACLAGLLNTLALLDVYGYAEKRWLAAREPASSSETVEGSTA
jgi:hypothetical protein